MLHHIRVQTFQRDYEDALEKEHSKTHLPDGGTKRYIYAKNNRGCCASFFRAMCCCCKSDLVDKVDEDKINAREHVFQKLITASTEVVEGGLSAGLFADFDVGFEEDAFQEGGRRDERGELLEDVEIPEKV